MTKSIHDNRIYSYLVHCEGRKIVLFTEFLEGDNPEYTDVVFSGVHAHKFHDQLEGNIIFDIEEVDPVSIFTDEREYIIERSKYGWPRMELPELTESAFRPWADKSGIKGYSIGSSYGLSGWVWAEKMDLVGRGSKADFEEV